MVRTVYLQIDADGIIRDCISYPYKNYVKFTGEVPQGCYGGWFKLEEGVIVEYPGLKPATESDRLNQLESAILELTMLIGGNV